MSVEGLDRTTRGFLLQFAERWAAGGQQWYARELIHAVVTGGSISELIVYCTGDWDEDLQRRHAAEVELPGRNRRGHRVRRYDRLVATDAVTPAALLDQADAARAAGQGARAAALYAAAADQADRDGDLDAQVTAALGLARCQEYNLTPGALPVRLHEPYARTEDPVQRARLAAALARCWAYTGEPRRARPFADEALRIAEQRDDPGLLADTLDAALAAYSGPDDLDRRRAWALRLGDVAAHLPDLDARLQAHLWALTLAWEVLDLARMHREVRALELLAAESPRAAFFAASRRSALDLLRGRYRHAACTTRGRGGGECRDADSGQPRRAAQHDRLHRVDRGRPGECAAEAPAFEDYGVSQGVVAVRAEAAMIWLGAGAAGQGARDGRRRSPPTFWPACSRDGDWLLTLQCVLEGGLATGDRRLVADVAPCCVRTPAVP